MRRHGAAELLVVLPDGSKRLIPAAWTDLEQQPAAAGDDAAATLGSVLDLLQLSVLVSGLLARAADGREQAARKSPCEEDDRAACSAQPDAGPDPGASPGSHRAVPGPGGGDGDGAAGRPDRQDGSSGRCGNGGRG